MVLKTCCLAVLLAVPFIGQVLTHLTMKQCSQNFMKTFSPWLYMFLIGHEELEKKKLET